MADSGWTATTVGSHAQVRARIGWRGLSAAEYTEEGPYLIAGKHILDGKVQWQDCDHITRRRYRESHEIALRESDVIVSKDGTIGRVARIDYLPGEATINGTMMLIRPGCQLDYRYLYHVLRGRNFQALVGVRISGSTIPHLFQRDVTKLVINLPPLAEQQRIADSLDNIDEHIQASEHVVEKLGALASALICERLTAITESVPQIIPLSATADVLSGVTLGAEPGGLGSIELPYLRVANVQDGYIDTADMKSIRILRSELSRYLLREGDVLLTEGGDLDKLGRGAMWDGRIAECVCQNHIFRVRCNEAIILPQYLSLYIVSSMGKAYFLRIAKQTTNLATINSTQLKAMPVPLPSLDDQASLARIMASCTKRIEMERRELSKLEALKQGLMEDLLTGRVRVTGRGAERAEAG